MTQNELECDSLVDHRGAYVRDDDDDVPEDRETMMGRASKDIRETEMVKGEDLSEHWETCK